MKKLALSILLSFSSVNYVSATGIPVVDATKLENSKQQQIEKISKMIAEYKKIQEQLEVQKSSLEAQTGIKDIAKISDNGQSYNALKDVYKNVNNPDDLFTKGVDVLNGDARKLVDNLKVSDKCKMQYSGRSKLQKMCEGKAINQLAQIAAQDQMIKSIDASVKNIDAIGKKMATATDIKQATDLSNQLEVQKANLKAQKMVFKANESKKNVFRKFFDKITGEAFNENLRNIQTYNRGNAGNFAERFETKSEPDNNKNEIDPNSSVNVKAQKASDIATQRAKAKSTGYCSRYVVDALQASGVKVGRGHARNMPAKLKNAGFKSVNISPSQAQKGDVVVYPPVKGHPYGHIAIYNGSRWVSDFKQNTPHAGAYKNAKPTIYRLPK